MSIFQKLFGGTSKSKYDAVLNVCDLAMVRDEIIDFHKMVNAQAEAEGGKYLFQADYVAAWENFRDNPNTESARRLLNVAPTLSRYSEACVPGGDLFAANSFLKKRGLK